MAAAPDLLSGLNPSQRAAVGCTADVVAILAGPGSGKTHTLTSRTAWLLGHQKYNPANVVVATFTVKAAREMRMRISRLVGSDVGNRLVLGTFHSIARRYLSRYGHLIHLPRDFSIADSSDSLAIIKRIVKARRLVIEPSAARSRISARKSRGGGADGAASAKAGTKSGSATRKSVDTQEMETCFTEYEDALRRSNLLDYDDLLLRCVDLLRAYPACISNVEAVLIDEFQDTNRVQLELMQLFAQSCHRITIVGDPDQSIYGFRAAETLNYSRLLRFYPETVTIPLEENYRSSGAILMAALAVIQQDPAREQKSLTPTHTIGTRPVLRQLPRADTEAQWLVTEIRRCIAMTGDLLDFDDVAILLRSAALSRLIESELGKAGIPYRMVGGLRFYDRVEVKTVLDYLRVIDQPGNNDALAHIINVPSRGIGEGTIKALLEEADADKITLWSLVLGIVQGVRNSRTKLRKPAERGLGALVNIILTARNKLDNVETGDNAIAACLKLILTRTNYEEWLRDHHNDAHKARWDNVQELVNQATTYHAASDAEDDSLPKIADVKQNNAPNALSRFLANVALASTVDQNTGDQSCAQVTISTIHAAKGLEWPVVFVPAAYQGSIPHSRAEDIDEERRLLYVAMTRAQALLYMSFPCQNSQGEGTEMSPFVAEKDLKVHLEKRGPLLSTDVIQSIAQILRRPLPSHEVIAGRSQHLPSRGDDIFPESRSDAQSSSGAFEPRYNPSYPRSEHQGQKRRRLEDDRALGSSHVLHATSMQQLTTSVTSCQSLSTTFVSAAQVQVVEESRPIKPEEKIPKKPTRKRETPGQRTLLGFLGKEEPSAGVFDLPEMKQAYVAPPVQITTHAFTARRPVQREPPTVAQMGGICPTLTTHRIAPAVRASSYIQQGRGCENTGAKSNYQFLSSSPPQPDENTIVAAPAAKRDSTVEIHAQTRPATLAYPTSMTMLAQNSSSRKNKTLGMRGSVGGWNTANKAFVPPTRMLSREPG